MNENKLQTIYALLREIDQAGMPVGSNYLSLKLGAPPASLGRVLQDLEYRGYLEKVSNKGRVLRQSGMEYMEELKTQLHSLENAFELHRLAMSTEKEAMLDMLYARRTIEREVILLACRTVTEKQIQRLLRIVQMQDSEKAADRSGEEQDLEFHLMLARISGNKSFEHILKLLLMQNNAYVRLSLIATIAKNMPNVISHHQIINALRNRDQERACSLIEQHIGFYMQYIEKHY